MVEDKRNTPTIVNVFRGIFRVLDRLMSLSAKFLKAFIYLFVFIALGSLIFTETLDFVEYKGQRYEYTKEYEGDGENVIAVFDIKGVISDECTPGYACARRINTLLDYLKDDKNVMGIIIFIDSPGGEVYASDKIYSKIKDVTKEKPVYVYAQNMLASGAYYISLGADAVFANKLTTVGSIGVMVELVDYDGLLDKLGIKVRRMTNTNGTYKTMQGLFDDNPNGPEDKMLQEILDTTYDRFVNLIVENRHIDEESVKRIADGRIMTADKAYANKLIDGVMPEQNVYDMAQDDMCGHFNCSIYRYNVEDNSIFGLLSSKLRMLNINSKEHFNVLYLYR